MNLGEKIDFLLKKTSMTKVELAKRLGLRDSSVVSHWVKNRFRPERENMEKMSHVFDKPMSYFSDDISYSQLDAERSMYEALLGVQPPSRHIGVVGSVRGSAFSLSLNGPVEEYLPIFLETQGERPFAFKIEDSSVCPGAQKGEYALIVPSTEAPEGRMALIKTGRQYMLGQVYYEKNKLVLKDGKKRLKLPGGEGEIVGVSAGFFRK